MEPRGNMVSTKQLAQSGAVVAVKHDTQDLDTHLSTTVVPVEQVTDGDGDDNNDDEKTKRPIGCGVVAQTLGRCCRAAQSV